MWAALLNRVTKRSPVLNWVQKNEVCDRITEGVGSTPPPKLVVSSLFRFGFFYKVRRNGLEREHMKRFRNITILHNQSLNRVNTAEKFIVNGAVCSCKRDVIPIWHGYNPDPKLDSLYSISDNCCRTNTIMPVPIQSSDQLLCCVNIWEEAGLQILLNKKQFSREILNISRPNSTLIRTATIKKYTVQFSFLGLKKPYHFGYPSRTYFVAVARFITPIQFTSNFLR